MNEAARASGTSRSARPPRITSRLRAALAGGLLTLALPGFAAGPKPVAPQVGRTSTVLEAVRPPLTDEDVGRALVEKSRTYVGARYLLSPLGEGAGFDADPLSRDDAFDCLTLVEQSLAQVHAPDPDAYLITLNHLRYSDAGISYASRLHLMEAQWLPTQVARGYLRDLTRALGGEATVRTGKILTRRTWTSVSSRALALPADRQVVGEFPIDMIPLEAMDDARLRTLPHGSLLVVVREERELKATRMTHLGIVLNQGGRVKLRHAARAGYGRVVDEDLRTFLQRNRGYRKWPVVGVSVYAPTRPKPPAVSSTSAGP